MIKVKKILLFFFITVFCSNISYAEISNVESYLKNNVVEKKLSNGINVTILNRGYSPTLALIISFKVGSADEGFESIGIAHMLEHMLFKGTDKIGTRNYEKEKKILREIEAVGETIDKIEIKNPDNILLKDLKKRLKKLQTEHKKYVVNTPYSQIYSKLGGINFNASTSRDRTSYYIELPSSRLEDWVNIETERLRNPVFRQYYLERQSVVQERLMRYESIGASNLVEKFIATAFIAHSYRHPIIGWQSNIKYLPLKEVKKFYYKNYIPSRMNITVVGKQNENHTLSILEKYFGKIKSKIEPVETIIKEPKQTGERRVEVKFKANPYLIIGWHKPTAPTKDDYVGDVVSYLLSWGRNSKLKKVLIEEKKMAVSVDTSNGFPGARYDNLFVVDAEPKTGYKTEDVEKEIYKIINSLKETITQKDINLVVNKIRSEMVFSLDSNMGVARKLNYYATTLNNWKYSIDYIKNIKKVTPEDIRQFIDKYLVKDNRTVGILVPEKK